MCARLIFKDGTEYEGVSFGAPLPTAGEVVFATGMVGYPESLTDPSFLGQILVYTYPLIGNYGVPDKSLWESDGIKVSGLVVCNYNDTPSHWQSRESLSSWLQRENIPALEISDTRGLTQKLRHHGVMLGRFSFSSSEAEVSRRPGGPGVSDFAGIGLTKSIATGTPGASGDVGLFHDPNVDNLVDKVSTKKIWSTGHGPKTIVAIDCGMKRNIVNCLVKRGLKVIVVPWDFDPTSLKEKFHAVFISNGPGDPAVNKPTIANILKLMRKGYPILGICLGNQLLALAGGGKTYKLKFGHRSQNQPCRLVGTEQCFLTTQNHGFAVGKIPRGFKEWFVNANDGTNEGIMHATKPWMSVQFHPEATPGPVDTEWIFDHFIERAKLGGPSTSLRA